MNTFTLADTRPYPQNPIKNHLLLNAYQLAHNSSQASRKLSSEQLQTEIRGMLQQNHYINLSLALTMTPDAGTYTALLSSVNSVLDCEKDGEVQWFALPLVLVSGCKKERTVDMKVPTAELFACLQNYPHLRALTQDTQWLPYLVHSSDLSAVTPDIWWRAKQNEEAAAGHLRSFEERPLVMPEGQSVHVVYALGFGSGKVQTALGQNLLQAGLPLMQVWQEYLAEENMTLFTNPLSPASPLSALADASRTRLRMALDVFSANVIRSVRLQSPRVGVVMAAQEGGRLLFGFNAAESAYSLMSQVFSWPLSPRDDIRIIQQDFLDLMVDCQVENIRLLHDILPENAALPDYADALDLPGHNPLFGNGSDGSENGVAN